jgi:hypothetical protein
MIRKAIQSGWQRYGGVLVSVALHALLLTVLVRWVVYQAADTGREVQVQVLETPPPPAEVALRPAEELPTDAAGPESPLSALPEAPLAETTEAQPDLAGLAVSDVASPVVLQGLYAGRTAAGRAAQLKKFGGGYGEQAEEAVLRSLRWLKAQQKPGGEWGEVSRYNRTWHSRRWTASMGNEQRVTRLTALSLLAFLAHGETPQSAEFGDTVRRAIDYLLSQQHPETGLFVPLSDSRPEKSGEDLGVYAHAQAVYALAEAYALTRAPALKRPVERGLREIIRGQLPGGAWGNWYVQNIADASATSWQIQALKAAAAAGLRPEGLDAAMRQAVAGIAGLYKGDGAWYYRKGDLLVAPREGGPIMSGAMVLSLQLLGRPNDPMVLAGLRYLNEFGVTEWSKAWENPINKSLPATYEWYYNTQAVFQRGGSRWVTWNADFAPMLLREQHPEGWWLGLGQRDEEEKIYSTCLCALSLQVYYRILPSFQQETVREPKTVFEDDVTLRIF